MKDDINQCSCHSEVPRYPAHGYKVHGLVATSKEKSLEEERILCQKLTEDAAFGQTFIKCPLIWYTFNTPVASVLQGFRKPICGLVALCMSGQMLTNLQPELNICTSSQILEEAIKLGISKQGEIFSIYDLGELAKKLYKCKVTVYENKLDHNCKTVLNHLLHGHPVLVPYDNDRNFEPCLKRGHRAHWALLTGAVIGHKPNVFSKANTEIHTDSLNVLKVVDRQSFSDDLNKILRFHGGGDSNPYAIYFYVKQGKSAKYRLWSLDSLSASNANLMERDPSRDWNSLHCPSKLTDTLCNRFIVLHF